MLSIVTINCQVTKIVMNSGFNYQNCSQCLKCHKSLGLLSGGLCLCLCICLCIFFGYVMSSHHSEQMSQRSQVSRIALRRCSQNVFVFVIVFVFVFVIFLVRSCLFITLMKCLKGCKSLGSLCNVKIKRSLSQSVS